MSTTGNILHASCPHFTSTTLRVGCRVSNPALATTITRSGGSPVSVTLDSSTSWGYADFTGLTPDTSYTFTFTVGGDVQSDVSLTYRTMPAGAPSSFKVVAGSCQFTASNHAVFDAIDAEDAAFVAHMGDLHYQNATTESGWRDGCNQSMGTAKMKAMLRTTPMTWNWDNHDRIIIDTLNLGTTDPATLTKYRTYAGPTGWGVTDSNCRTWVAGRVRFIQTDQWTNRDDPDLVADTDEAPRKMMGEAQKAWLLNIFDTAQEPVIIWFTQWTAQNHQNGRWNSFSRETSLYEKAINARPGLKQRMILCGGDSHSLQADTGVRTTASRFQGIPSLNISGFNRASDVGETVGGWNIANRSIKEVPNVEPEPKYGSYSLFTIDDDGATITVKWDGVRVRDDGVRDVLASYERKVGTAMVGGKVSTLNMFVGSEVRMQPVPAQIVGV